jgi:hypothetical protein
MAWFVAYRAAVRQGLPTDHFEYRVFSEAQIETIGREWDWASAALDTEKDAQLLADSLNAEQRD